ncbi:hypothetical protein CKAH01_15288 [Colletotrichum kahawae]|uniref:Uncharacterized protein n=1 Tax=Colletotrichum kahawae TaxID=34407 RepID=A0AAD9YHQ2_COLKA|nr:hypothetical protein CKAH01_15288 [Colletotrichum kahawae]
MPPLTRRTRSCTAQALISLASRPWMQTLTSTETPSALSLWLILGMSSPGQLG